MRIKFERNSSIDFKTECELFCCVFKSVLNASQEKMDEKSISSWFTLLSILYEPYIPMLLLLPHSVISTITHIFIVKGIKSAIYRI